MLSKKCRCSHNGCSPLVRTLHCYTVSVSSQHTKAPFSTVLYFLMPLRSRNSQSLTPPMAYLNSSHETVAISYFTIMMLKLHLHFRVHLYSESRFLSLTPPPHHLLQLTTVCYPLNSPNPQHPCKLCVSIEKQVL